jgi:hypothetical protein
MTGAEKSAVEAAANARWVDFLIWHAERHEQGAEASYDPETQQSYRATAALLRVLAKGPGVVGTERSAITITSQAETRD